MSISQKPLFTLWITFPLLRIRNCDMTRRGQVTFNGNLFFPPELQLGENLLRHITKTHFCTRADINAYRRKLGLFPPSPFNVVGGNTRTTYFSC